MPELPEVETIRLALSKIIKNARIKKVEIFRNDLRWKLSDNIKINLEKDVLSEPYRRGKYILIPTLKNNILLIHLGMSGQIKIQKKYFKLRHDHLNIIVQTQDDTRYSITYNDPRRFGFIDLLCQKKVHEHFLLKNLGVDALSKDLTVNYLKKIFHNRKKCIKDAIIDQKIIAGVGNIYASEILYRAKINPHRSLGSLNESHLKSIIQACKFILNNAIKVGGTTIQNHVQPDGKLGYFTQKLKVYGRKQKKCKKCKNIVVMSVISKRSTFFCNYCQK